MRRSLPGRRSTRAPWRWAPWLTWRSLVENGARLDSVDWWERTPLARSREDRRPRKKARYLADCGADLTVTGKGGASPLDLAIESFSTPMLKWLIELGISVESAADCCITPLMTAVQAGNAEAVDALIEAGAEVDRRTACGCALDSAETREMALRLLDSGSRPRRALLQRTAGDSGSGAGAGRIALRRYI